MPLSPEAAELDSLFNTVANELQRDQYGRPLLIPGAERAANPYVKNRGGKARPDGRLPYTRASSLANYVSDQTALHTWMQRSLTKGLGDREDLAAMAAGLPPIIANGRNKNTLTKEERTQDAETNRALDEIAEAAMISANQLFKANWGTAIHSFTDPGDHGPVPARMGADVAAWEKATARWTFHGTELFVRNDELQSAGTFDHIVEIPSRPDLGAVVVDKKTGLLHMDQHAVQLEVYAGGELYDPDTDTVRPWPVQVNRDWGLIAHIPLGMAICDFYLIDLQKGHRAALTAIQVRDHRSDKDLAYKVDFVADERRSVAGVLAVAESRDEMLEIHRQHQHIWNQELSDLGAQRIAALAEAA